MFSKHYYALGGSEIGTGVLRAWVAYDLLMEP